MIDSFVCSENVETEDLNEQADEVEKCEQAAIIIKEYEDISGIKWSDTLKKFYSKCCNILKVCLIIMYFIM